jgi:hypothetical protein
MNRLYLVIFSFLFLSACGTSPDIPADTNKTSRNGATLHTIIVADTNDFSIGESVQIDLQNMQGLIQNISQHTGLVMAGEAITGDEVSSSNINNAINNLSVGSDDVVIFYYSGHGYNPGNSKWPGMSLENGTLTIKDVRNMLKQKNPRLLIVMADTCNGFTRGVSRYYKSPEKTENYNKLFLKYRGIITASSSKPGQLSWGNKQTGGLYTDALLRSFNKELASQSNPSWERLMEHANKPLNGGKLQEPQYKAEVSMIGASISFDPSGTRTLRCKSNYFHEGGQECCTLTNDEKRCWMDD